MQRTKNRIVHTIPNFIVGPSCILAKEQKGLFTEEDKEVKTNKVKGVQIYPDDSLNYINAK